MHPRISVVIASRDRAPLLRRLLDNLNTQTLPADTFEVIVVDDGSVEPVAPMLDALTLVVPLRHCRTAGIGQAGARQAASALASGDVIAFVDDDMQVERGFLAAHLAYHTATPHAVVLGRIASAPLLEGMPLFERYHARQLERWRESVLDGRVTPHGTQLCTGNVSMLREDFEAVGGFNVHLMRSEDRELGLRLEQHECVMVCGDRAVSVHCSDHADLAVWMRRAYLYGRYDHRIAALHPDVPQAHPWRFWPLIHPVSRPVVAVSLVAPRLGGLLARAAYACGAAADRVGLDRIAVTLTALTYALLYFRGLRDELGSFRAFWNDRPKAPQKPRSAFGRMTAAIRADHDQMRDSREKYHGDVISRARLPLDLVSRIGFQMMAWYRVMHFLHEVRVPVVPMVMSRLVRHLYGAEIHWRAHIAPGVSIVHGNSLVISHAAVVGTGCILFQNVTLGESIDPVSGIVGAPRLGEHVHVGPGATLLGPIQVGARTKVGAAALLMRSVPEGSLVMMADAVVTTRRQSRGSHLHPVRRVAV